MKLYRFSPIRNEKQLIETVKYIATETTKLCKKVIGKSLLINSLTIFSHYADEYEQLIKIIHEIGKPYNEHNGLCVNLHKPIKVSGHSIQYLRIRKPDPYRMHVGCNDFEVEGYQSFKKIHTPKHPQNLRIIERPDYEMIEFFDPDFDVLAYVVSKRLYC